MLLLSLVPLNESLCYLGDTMGGPLAFSLMGYRPRETTLGFFSGEAYSPPQMLHYRVLSAEVVLMVRMLLPRLEPPKRILAGGEELLFERVVDAERVGLKSGVLGQASAPDVLARLSVAVELEVLALAGRPKSVFGKGEG
jgi:hypothetical protein